MVLSYPNVREFVAEELAKLVKDKFPDSNKIAGIATAGIAHGMLCADRLGMSYCYVRPEPKKHGLKNQVEGQLEEGDRVVLIEDLISTGKSSFQAVEGVKNAGGIVVGVIALFTYGFEEAKIRFENAGIPVYTISDFPTLAEVAAHEGYINTEDIEKVKNFANDPKGWGSN